MTMNRKQRESLWRLFQRDGAAAYETPRDTMRRYRAFRRTATYADYVGCWLVQWCGMTLGIESDGYTHS